MNARITRVGSMYGMVYVENGKEVGRVLDRNAMPKIWKTRKGAEAYAKRTGMELV